MIKKSWLVDIHNVAAQRGSSEDQNKNLYILFEVPQETEPDKRKYRVMRFNAQGNFIDQLDLSVNANSIDRWDIVDFYPDHQNGIYLLEILETNQHKLSHWLRRINSQGNDIWVKQGELNYQKLDFPSFAGKFESLIAPDENSLYLPVRSPKQGLASFDVATGEILAVYNWDEPSDKLTISSAKEVYFSRLLDDASGNRHVLIKRSLTSDKREVIESKIQYLHNLAGVDAKGNIYPRASASQMLLT